MKKQNKVITVLLAICLIISLFSIPVAAQGINETQELPIGQDEIIPEGQRVTRRVPMDIKNEVAQGAVVIYAMAPDGSWTTAVTDDAGQLIHPQTPSLLVGQGLAFNVKWSIDDVLEKNLVAGDWFTYTLPSNYFNFTVSGPYSIKAYNETTGAEEEIGTFEIVAATATEPAKLKVSLTAIGVSKNYIRDAELQVVGMAQVIREETAPEDSDIKIEDAVLPPIIIKPIPEQGFGNKAPLEKNGWQVPNQDRITWGTYVNYDVVRAVFDGEMTGVNTKNSAIFIDELPEGIVFDSLSNIDIAMPIYAATSDGKMSTTLVQDTAGWNNYTPSRDALFTQVIPASGETLVDFQTRVEAAAAPSYGVFRDAADGNRDKIIINLGDIPGAINSPMDKNAIFALIDGDSALSSVRKQHTKDAYDRVFAESGGSGVLGYVIQIQYLDVTGNADSYTNTAKLKWSTGDEETSDSTVRYDKIEGHAIAGDAQRVVIQKKDADTGVLLEGAVFKLQKWNETVWVDYVPLSGTVERTTDGNGEVMFSQLTNGEYRVVEVTPPTGYETGITFESGKDTFTITGTEQEAVHIIAYNKAYAPNETSITVSKVWADNNNEYGKRPVNVQVQLMGNGVAIGTSVLLDAGNDWTHTWNNLPEEENGKIIRYTVQELAVPIGYVAEVSEKDKNNIVLTNIYTNVEPENAPTGTTIEPPKTGDIGIGVIAVLCMMSFSAVFYFVFRIKKL